MAEPFAVGVLGSLIFPRAGSAVTRSNSLSRATRSNGQISLAANFFSPAPRRQKGSHKHKATPVVATIVGNVLYCQSWACPTSKEWLWHNGRFYGAVSSWTLIFICGCRWSHAYFAVEGAGRAEIDALKCPQSTRFQVESRSYESPRTSKGFRSTILS